MEQGKIGLEVRFFGHFETMAIPKVVEVTIDGVTGRYTLGNNPTDVAGRKEDDSPSNSDMQGKQEGSS